MPRASGSAPAQIKARASETAPGTPLRAARLASQSAVPSTSASSDLRDSLSAERASSDPGSSASTRATAAFASPPSATRMAASHKGVPDASDTTEARALAPQALEISAASSPASRRAPDNGPVGRSRKWLRCEMNELCPTIRPTAEAYTMTVRTARYVTSVLKMKQPINE